MKKTSFFARIAAVAAAVMAFASPMAHAESSFATAPTAALTATARLNFEIDVDKYIFLQVGTGTLNTTVATVDNPKFAVTGAINGNATAISGGTALTTVVKGNAGDLTLTNNGSGNLTAGLLTIPMTKITPVVTGTVPHAAFGGSSTLTSALGIVNLSGTWAFTYANDVVVGAGIYTKTVTYTLTSL